MNMNKIKKLLFGLVLFRIMLISFDTPIIIPMTTPPLTITSYHIDNDSAIRYITIDTTILYYFNI